MKLYALPSHVSMCTVSNGAVFLDLRRDKYFGISVADARSLSRVVPGWPASYPDDEVAPETAEERAITLAERFVADGLLSRQTPAGKKVSIASTTSACRAFTSHTLEVRPHIRAIDMVRFSIAIIRATWQIRLRSLEAIVLRQQSTSRRQVHCRPIDLERMRQLVSIFDRLRPLVFTSRNRCLFDSLALLEYLAQYGVRPSWIFGVSVNPFAAHCWLQYGDLSLNSEIETTREYVPILTI
jgi:hypothetical protein